MLNTNVPEKQTSLVVPPKRMEVVLADDERDPLSVVMPPTEDLTEIAALKSTQYSLTDSFPTQAERFAEGFGAALEHAKEKFPRHSKSPTYLNRLANLALAAGEYEQETHFLEQAEALTHDAFFLHARADNLVARNLDQEAEGLFSRLDLSQDLEANLKLATFAVRRREFDAASGLVSRALSINPSSFAARLFEGGLCLVTRQWSRAVHSFRIAAEDRATSSVLFCNLGFAYTQLNQPEKAFAALKRAVALGPLNENAIFLLADYSSQRGNPEEAVPALRYFLTFEQKNADAWRRLARALFSIGEIGEAISALRAEASIQDSSGVWNNLGVAYMRHGEVSRALSAFKHAMSLGVTRKDHGYFLAGLNIAQHFANEAMNKALLGFARGLVVEDADEECARDDLLSDVYVFYLLALGRAKQYPLQRAEAERILSIRGVAEPLKAWVYSTVTANYALTGDDGPRLAVQFIERNKESIDRLTSTRNRELMVYNNVAFAFAEAGLLSEAERYLSRVGNLVHRDPYATATLGLIDMRKGRVDRAVERYKEAFGLLRNHSDKVQFRQKLNLELGRYWATRSPSKARRYFERVLAARGGVPNFEEVARTCLRDLEAS
jgi:tetratricopeptide (TPR) repeat protein